MLREIDIPPLWLGLALALSWALSWIWAWPMPGIGLALIGLGAVLMVVAVAQMLLSRTTFIPRRNPRALVTAGVFRISRNPIYLADALILTGAILYWGALFALPVIPAFMSLIMQRYIKDEENRLHAGFGAECSTWAARVGRWLGPL